MLKNQLALSVVGMSLLASASAVAQPCTASSPAVVNLGACNFRFTGTYRSYPGATCFLSGIDTALVRDVPFLYFYQGILANAPGASGYFFNLNWVNNGGPQFNHVAATGFVPPCGSDEYQRRMRKIQDYIRNLPPSPRFYLRTRSSVMGVRGFAPGEVVLNRNLGDGEIGRWSKFVVGVGAVPLVDGVTSTGSTISGSGTATMTITDIDTPDEGLYVFHAGTSEPLPMIDTVQVYIDRGVPEIHSMPQDREACLGGSTEFQASASGTNTLYRWYRDGLPLSDGLQSVSSGIQFITGATTATMTLTGLAIEANGSYECRVSSDGSGFSNPTFPARLVVSNNTTPPLLLSQPVPVIAAVGTYAEFIADVDAPGNEMPGLQWRRNGVPIVDNGRIEGSQTERLSFSSVVAGDVGQYDCIVTRGCASTLTNAATLSTCAADLDNGSGTGTRDGGVDVSDLLYFLASFEAGSTAVDLDNGSGTGTPDGGVDISDLLFFLARFEAGC